MCKLSTLHCHNTTNGNYWSEENSVPMAKAKILTSNPSNEGPWVSSETTRPNIRRTYFSSIGLDGKTNQKFSASFK
jgi:hypothetical protein